jgi:class 3 adenylate cyclase
VVALVLIAFRPYAVAVLLFPLLYLWPRFDARLNRRLYPQRARFPELLRNCGDELAACESVDSVLEGLARQPARLCDARNAVAFLFAGVNGTGEHVRATDHGRIGGAAPLGSELLIQLMRTTRTEIRRADVAVQPQYENIKDECYAVFDRLRADLLLPMVHEHRVVGGLAVGARVTGDVYEQAEIDALSTATQQAVQAIMRIEASERLRAREREFADLKRFFPPQIIDQVMARGGAAELRSQRKVVSVVFADLRGFTSFSDSVEPEEVMATLAEYHTLMGARIAEFAGTLERFAGDGFMVFFNDPVEQPDHAERAVQMVLAMHADLDGLRDRWRRKGYSIDVGTGVHTGYATCGFIGYEGRRDYAVIGNVANLAARLSDAAGAGEILVTARVRSELGDRYRMDPIGELSLKGFHQPQLVYRLVGHRLAVVRSAS